jgi:hypothetical protein
VNEDMKKTWTEIKNSSAFKLSGKNSKADDKWEEWFQVAMPPSLNAVSN